MPCLAAILPHRVPGSLGLLPSARHAVHVLEADQCKQRGLAGRVRCVCVALGFGLAPSLWTFIPPFAIGELALFSIQARGSDARQCSGFPAESSPHSCKLPHLVNC